MPPKRKAPDSDREPRKRLRTRSSKAQGEPQPAQSSKIEHASTVAKKSTSSTAKGTGKRKATKPSSTGSVARNNPSTTKLRSRKSPVSEDSSSSDAQAKAESPAQAEKDIDTKEIGEDAKETDKSDSKRRYWLMKAEPEDRFENGHNVKFSIDDLEAATKSEPWDGVRNYVARNNMIAMRKGDLAFFYHSNCASPGIVGVMRIVQEHTVDESAFDTKHPYFDPKSKREKPRWELVHVGFVKKFKQKISLKEIQQNAASSKELEAMDLLKYKRLSVTAVKPNEWDFILQWAGESKDVGV